MPWQVEWYDDQHTVLLLTPIDPWGWQDFKAAADRQRDLTLATPHTVHLIFNLGRDFKLPPRTEDAPPAPWMPVRDAILQSPSNRGLVVMVAAPLFIESIAANVDSVLKHQTGGADSRVPLKFVNTLNEALAAIEQARSD